MAMEKKELVTIDTAQAQEIISEGAIIPVEGTAKERLQAAIMTIKRSQVAMRANQFAIALQLKGIYDNQLYKAGGYENVYEMAQKEFDYKRASVNNMIRIATAFLQADDEGKIRSIFAKGDVDFKYSQLQELLRLPVEDVKALVENGVITADDKVEEIRDKVKTVKPTKHIKKSKKAENGAGEVNTADQTAIDELTTENASLKAQVEKLQAQIAEMQKQLDESNGLTSILASKLLKANGAFDESIKIGLSIKAENKKLKSENSRLHKKLRKLNADDKPVWLTDVSY